jgi:hypothetical protein
MAEDSTIGTGKVIRIAESEMVGNFRHGHSGRAEHSLRLTNMPDTLQIADSMYF